MANISVILTTRSGGTITVDPIPQGLEDIVIELRRDEESHGMFFEYGIDRLTFFNGSAEAIEDEYESEGVNGFMGIVIKYMCAEVGGYEELFNGALDFGTYKRLCGLECSVSIELEPADDVMRFRNNFDQKVDLLSPLALDEATFLTEYEGLNFDMEIPSRELRVRLQGEEKGGNFPIYPIQLNAPGFGNAAKLSVRPSFTVNQIAELQTADLTGSSNYRVYQFNEPPIHPQYLSPILDFTIDPGCSGDLLNYNIRLKGRIFEQGFGLRDISIQLVFHKGEYTNQLNDPNEIGQVLLFDGFVNTGPGPDINFDHTFTGVVPVDIGDKFTAQIWFYVNRSNGAIDSSVYVTWDAETSVSLYTNTLCPPTTSKVFAINETLSRVSESITNNGLRVFSDFFGRTDSQPYARPVDSCAGLFNITSGLNIRRKLLPNGEQPGFFKSFRELYDDLNSMWNIGFTIEPDGNRPGFNRLRIENWEHFYQNQVILTFSDAVQIEKNVDLSKVYNQLLIGFEKWEAQRNTGLDEFMTQRTYRVDVNTINNALDRMCQMILSTYCIEETRRLRDNTQDWTYDNDTFGFIMKRGEGNLNMTVEMMAESAVQVENILNSGTCYNVRVSPARNAMRWFNFIMQGLKVLDASKKLWFSEGKGNYVAAYRLIRCYIEGAQLQENDNIDVNLFADGTDAHPITFAETETFEHPFSFSTFRKLKNEPDLMFKAIRYYCNSIASEGWIKLITYRLNSGHAQITTIPKNTLQMPVPVPPCDAIVSDLVYINCGEGCYRFEWNDAIGDNWRWSLFNADTLFPDQQGTTNSQFVQLTNLVEGNYIFQVIPYCGDSSGQNILEYNISVTPPNPIIQLSAYKFFAESIQEWKWKVVAEPVNTANFVVHCEFFFKRCSFYDGSTHCNTDALGEWGEIQCVVGASSTTGDTWGAETQDSTLLEIKIRLASLSGMTPDQIIKKPGETWNLIFE